MPRSRKALRHRRGIAGIAAVMIASIALVAQQGITTDASWTDAEWTNGRAMTTPKCSAATGQFAARGEGRALSGGLLGINLDTLAEASGVEVTQNGDRSKETRGVATSLGNDAYSNPLNVVALSAVNVNLGQGILQLPLDNSLGVLGQYGQAQSTGVSVGASGFVTNTGGIALAPGNGYPQLGTINLKNLLNSTGLNLGTLVSGVTDVDLELGAVAGRATLNGCSQVWQQSVANALTRDYLASSVKTKISSPTVGALVTGVSNTITTLEQTVNQVAGNAGVTSSIVNGTKNLLNSLISNPILSLGEVTATVSATINTTAVRSLLTETITDSGGVVAINLAQGTITVNTAALLAAAYPGSYGSGLNSLPPNTDLLGNKTVVPTLTAAVNNALNSWIARVNTALTQAIDAVSVTAAVTIALRVEVCTLGCLQVPIGTISANVHGSLKDLLAGTVQATTSTNLNLGAIGAILSGIVNPLINTLLGGLVNGLGKIAGDAVNAVLNTLRTLPSTVLNLAPPITNVVANVYAQLFISGVVQLLVNAQNAPAAVPGAGAAPADWSTLPAGRFDVAALRVGVLGALPANSVRLYLGRGSVGTNCLAERPPSAGSPCRLY
ncbi:choice-of-anchor G family protein [Leucobacter sp. UT-8R-CII-1-4]|uniref:choice-of-anchor G family protein n=1 Tax=Leucobacter sp. UT-8R-CII-1-4 TaxID=3040075 RepID=UPI0024A8DAB5|nr:choice-of-anchor G family protein [Leucobacter sp. UT-8R-CII-1-4]MDI6023705.1 choice-of-anchor G family protein [Leucobacter sp. UT-8R-CII-1-4]